MRALTVAMAALCALAGCGAGGPPVAPPVTPPEASTKVVISNHGIESSSNVSVKAGRLTIGAGF